MSASPGASAPRPASRPPPRSGSRSPLSIVDVGPDAASGTPTDDDSSNGGSTTQTYITVAPAAGLVIGGSATPLDSASITLTIVRGVDSPSSTGVDRFSATIVLDSPSGTVEAAATGEALFVGGTWKLRGRVTVDGGSAQVPGRRRRVRRRPHRRSDGQPDRRLDRVAPRCDSDGLSDPRER